MQANESGPKLSFDGNMAFASSVLKIGALKISSIISLDNTGITCYGPVTADKLKAKSLMISNSWQWYQNGDIMCNNLKCASSNIGGLIVDATGALFAPSIRTGSLVVNGSITASTLSLNNLTCHRIVASVIQATQELCGAVIVASNQTITESDRRVKRDLT